jgi:hypothetical protein
MTAIRLSREETGVLLSNRRFTLSELAIVIGEGSSEQISEGLDTSYFELASELLEEDLPGYLAVTDIGIPTIISNWDDSSICPASITFRTCYDWISLPIFNHDEVKIDIQNILQAIPSVGDDNYPEEQEEQEKLWTEIATKFKVRAFGWLSSYLARESHGFAPGWIGFAMNKLGDEDTTYCQVIVTSSGTDGSSHVFGWTKYWNALDEHEGPHSRTVWKPNSTIEVVSRDSGTDTVDFKFVDEDGFELFRTSTDNLNQLWNALSKWGWNFSEVSNNSVTLRAGDTSFSSSFGKVEQRPAENRKTQSPTPAVRPTQQRGGASINSGIVQGSVNVTGLSQVNGIVQGDVNVPSGADVNVNGIVQGIVRVNGGTARLYGTIAGAAISSGRIEVYGILQSPLQYSGGDVYYDPNSLIA